MPSVDCERELSMYQKLGIRPEYITAVEYNRKDWKDFSRRVAEFGAQPVFGDLRKLAPKFDKDFKIIALDFMGQYSLKTLDILTQLPTQDQTILMVNQRCARERSEIQKQLYIDQSIASGNFSNIQSALSTDKRFWKIAYLQSLEGEAARLNDFSSGNYEKSHSLAEVRNQIAAGILYSAGRFRRDKIIYPELLDKLWFSGSLPTEKKCKFIFGDIATLERTLMSTAIQTMSLVGFPDWLPVPGLVSFTAFRSPLPRLAESWEYKTEGSSKHTFLSHFVVLDRPMDKYKRWDNAVRPFLDFVLSYPFSIDNLKVEQPLYTEIVLTEKMAKQITQGFTKISGVPKELVLKTPMCKARLDLHKLKRVVGEFKQLYDKYSDPCKSLITHRIT